MGTPPQFVDRSGFELMDAVLARGEEIERLKAENERLKAELAAK